MADYVTTNPLTTAAWQKRLNENKLGAIKPSIPIMLYHGTQDMWVPPQGAKNLKVAWCALGVQVKWADYISSHTLTAVGAAQDSVNYLNDRFNGVPAPTSC